MHENNWLRQVCVQTGYNAAAVIDLKLVPKLPTLS